MTHLLYYYAITGSCKEPSKKPKGGSNETGEELESKPFLSECLDALVSMHQVQYKGNVLSTLLITKFYMRWETPTVSVNNAVSCIVLIKATSGRNVDREHSF